MTDSAAPGSATLVVGLGNPGTQYQGTRHNVGAMITTVLAERLHTALRRHKTGASTAEGRLTLGGPRLIAAVTGSYMNVSGKPVGQLMRFFSLTPPSLIVAHDDLDLPYGTLRVKRGGGEGGHNGLKSITASLGTREYVRLRFGIGRPPGRMNPADFVLQKFSTTEAKTLATDLELAADAVEMLVTDGLTATQNQLHQHA